MMKIFLIVSMAFIVHYSAMAQEKVVSGTVTAFKSLAIGNIKVEAKKAGTAVLTDSTGSFLIVTHQRDVLVFTSNLFKKERVRVNKNTDSIFVSLRFEGSEDDIERAVGYGYMKSRDISFAMSHIDNKNVDFCSYSDIFELIRGRSPGVQIMNMGGGEPSVIIRGMSSINLDNTALYVVDGMVVHSISNIPPCFVKNISFIKDGAASIYGSRGANGVVLIETKKSVQP